MPKSYNPSKNIKICCERMAKQLEDFRFPIDMDPVVRRYFIPYIWPHSGIYSFDYCPWCGIYLSDLRDIREEVLEKEYGIINRNDPNIPDEFYTEEWWIKRGL